MLRLMAPIITFSYLTLFALYFNLSQNYNISHWKTSYENKLFSSALGSKLNTGLINEGGYGMFFTSGIDV